MSYEHPPGAPLYPEKKFTCPKCNGVSGFYQYIPDDKVCCQVCDRASGKEVEGDVMPIYLDEKLHLTS